jgi:hypothetical protein
VPASPNTGSAPKKAAKAKAPPQDEAAGITAGKKAAKRPDAKKASKKKGKT